MTDNARLKPVLKEKLFDRNIHLFTGSSNPEIYSHIAEILKNRNHLSLTTIQKCFSDRDIDFAIEYLEFMDIIEEGEPDIFSLVPGGIERLNKITVNASSIKANREENIGNNEGSYTDYEKLLKREVELLVSSVYFDCYERGSFNILKFESIIDDDGCFDYHQYESILEKFPMLSESDLDELIIFEATGFPAYIEDILFNKLKIEKESIYINQSIGNLKQQYQNYINSIN